jgi:hypothetical protein
MHQPIGGPVTTDVITSTRSAVNLPRATLIAACLGVASFVVLAPMGYPLAAAFFCGGLGLGLLNTRLVQRSAARFAASGDPSKRRFAVAVLARLALITALAVGLAMVVQPEGLGVFAGLAALPLIKELRRSQVEGQSGIKDQPGAPV